MNTKHSKPLQVLMMPDYRQDNPYQSLLADALESERVKVVFPQGYRRILPLFRAVKDNSCDILHLHWLDPYTKGKKWLTQFIYSLKFLIDIFWLRCCGIKVIWTVHNQLTHDSKFSKLDLWTRRILCRLVDRIIFHNYDSLNMIAQEYNFHHSKAEVIPIGNYRKIYRPAIEKLQAKKELDLPLDSRIYLNQGVLRPYKGIEKLLQAWQQHQQQFKQDILLIVGKPINEEYGLRITQLANEISGVKLHPYYIRDDQMHLFFSAADLAILPFEKILTSSSVVLAMSYGKPVIAPKLGGISETLGEANSLLYDPQEVDGLLGALEKSTHSDLNQLSQQVIKSCDCLDWQNIATKTSTVYQNSLNNQSVTKYYFREKMLIINSIIGQIKFSK